MPAPPRVDAVRVKQLIAAGLTPAQVAARLGCDRSTVGRIARDRYEKGKR